jgi:hypothetical protein
MTTEVIKRDEAIDAPPVALTVGPPPTALLATTGELQAMWAIARTVFKAKGMVPAAITTPEQAMGVMLAGWELGLRPMTSLRHVFIVNGKTDIETRAMVGIIRQRDPRIRFEWPEYTNDAVTCVLHRPGQSKLEVRYTVEDAKRSGQYEGKMGIWKSYTRDMLYAAATKRACRIGCPDLINAIEGSMTPVAEATAAAAPFDVRVLDEGDTTVKIAADAYDQGDDPAAPLAVEVEAPPVVNHRERIVDLLKRFLGETSRPQFMEYVAKIEAEHPQWFEKHVLKVALLTDDEAHELADKIAADLGVAGPTDETGHERQ